MLDAFIQGILLGGYYAILAAGLSLMFGVVRFINLAHGDLAIFGAYLVLFAVEILGISPWVALIGVLPAMAALGWILQAGLFARTARGGVLLPLLTTFGLGAMLQNGMFGLFGPDTQSLGNHIGSLSWASWQLPFGISVGKLPVITFGVAVAVLVALQLTLSFTKLGRAIRATSSDPEAAELCGIDARFVHRAAAAIALALAGLAGAFLAMRALITPYAGPAQLIFAFEAVVIGGIGSLWGTLVGGIVLGVAQSLGATVSAQWFQLSGHLVFLAVLASRLFLAHAARHGGLRVSLGGRGRSRTAARMRLAEQSGESQT
ncbi:branched-chain amino acid ABC transporter permease [Pelagibacterium halotolerans]|uniref:branched-chain amino acid ABC transporter permease n=1 Tax=Pelagibacterium halotolerans TaxID=531813 RepID=UPI0038514072